MAKSKRANKTIKGPVQDLEDYLLVEIIRGKGKENRKNCAYNEIEKRIRSKIFYITRQFYIPGCSSDDVLQEALYALRYKAIPDYDGTKGRGDTFYPFDKFAALCIRRHLSTLLKSCFQNKRKTLNTSLSLDQDRTNLSDDNLHLSDIIPRTEGTVDSLLGDKEYYNNLFKKLFMELSVMERRVYKLYIRKYSYEEISDIINKFYKKNKIRKRADKKSIDNSISRIKQKGKKVFEKYKEIFEEE